jgi:hypothetical protein
VNLRVFAPFLLVLFLGTPLAAEAQPFLFGSADDPLETSRPAWWLRESFLEPSAGLSLIGAQWRTAFRGRARFETRRTLVELDGSLRAGIYGRYRPGANDAYDLLRVVRFARLNTQDLYLRLGSLTRTRMGHGLLMDFYNGGVAWDERGIGIEFAAQGRMFRFSGMTSDIRLNRVVAARLEFFPRGRSRTEGGLRIGVGLVTDLRYDSDSERTPTGREIDVRFTAARSGGFRLEPFAGAAELLRYGRGMMLGADLQTDNFIDLARVHFRVALQYAEARFLPGYYGSFYEVHNPSDRILGTAGLELGVPILETSQSTYLLTEFRLMFFESFELWYAFRRHFGLQALSTYHLRLFLRAGPLKFAFSEDRRGLTGFLSLLSAVGDESVMSFRVDYRLAGPLWLHVDARYGYAPLPELGDGIRYAVQRQFEPFLGLRATF